MFPFHSQKERKKSSCPEQNETALQKHTNPYSPPFTVYMQYCVGNPSCKHCIIKLILPQRNCLPNLTVWYLPSIPFWKYICMKRRSHGTLQAMSYPVSFLTFSVCLFLSLPPTFLCYHSCILRLCSQIELSLIFIFLLLEEGTVCIQLSTLFLEISFPFAAMIQLIMKQLLSLHNINQQF